MPNTDLGSRNGVEYSSLALLQLRNAPTTPMEWLGPSTSCAATPKEAGEQSVETASKFSPQKRAPKKPPNRLRHCPEKALRVRWSTDCKCAVTLR